MNKYEIYTLGVGGSGIFILLPPIFKKVEIGDDAGTAYLILSQEEGGVIQTYNVTLPDFAAFASNKKQVF